MDHLCDLGLHPDGCDLRVEIDHCEFPGHLLYDLENMVWVETEDGVATVGSTSILSALAGKLTRITFKPLNASYERGRSLGTIESLRFVGALRTPVTGVLIECNLKLTERPRLLNDSPYTEGWFARLRLSRPEELQTLRDLESIQTEISCKISELRIRCFKAYPDYEMYEIGVECAAVLVRLNELIRSMQKGEIVHIVSDDPTAYVEMVRWTEQFGQRLADWREEGNLSHFLVEKLR